MGCRSLAYWSATFAFDLLVFSATLIVFVVVVSIGYVDFITECLGKIVATLFAFAISYIPFSYMCGFMYKKANSALKGN